MSSLSLDIARGCEWSALVTQQLIGFPQSEVTLEEGKALVATSAQQAPAGIVPFALVDTGSLACVVEREDIGLPAGSVLRWQLADVPSSFQAMLLDTSVVQYLDSLEAELAARESGRRLMTEQIMPTYEKRYLAERSLDEIPGEQETDRERGARLRAQVTLDYERPRGEVLRPVRMACQNVVIGLAAMAYDSDIDGLAVAAWQTCDVPHVATHEANRALLALTLCDAFATGGTMEVRFDRPRHLHPEGKIPASLARFARSVDIDVFDDDDSGGLSPRQARDLFLACTPLPGRLGEQVVQAVELGLTSVERICFTILSQTLAPVAMEYLLATTGRSGSILRGGDQDVASQAMAAELAVLETAIMLGMLVGRLESVDHAAASVRVVEAQKHAVDWHIDVATGAITVRAPNSPPPKWPGSDRWPASGEVVVYPRARPVPEAEEAATQPESSRTFTLVPSDQSPTATTLQAPIRLSELRTNARAVLSVLRSARA